MRLKYLVIPCLFFFILQANAQDIARQIILINGEIIDAKDNSPVPFVHVINTSRSQGTVSNTQGRFTIQMMPEDTLVFSAIGFEKYIFTLAEGVDTKGIRVIIRLDDSKLELEPVKVFAYKDEHSLKRAIIEMELPEEKPKRMQLKGLGFYYGPRRTHKITPLSPISFIASRISKKETEKRKYAKVTADYDHWMTTVYQKYNPTIVREVTSLPEDQVDDFMRFCKLDNSFISLSTEYEVVVAIHKCLEAYNIHEAIPKDSLEKN